MRDIRETDILRICLRWLQLQGIYCWRQNQGALSAVSRGKRRFFRFATATGISDIVGLLRPAGRFLAVEIKRPGRSLTVEQAAFLATIRDHGGVALCVHSLEELQEALRRPDMGC